MADPTACPVCLGSSLKERAATEHELEDERTGNIPPGLSPPLRYFVCADTSCKAAFTWPQPPSIEMTVEQAMQVVQDYAANPTPQPSPEVTKAIEILQLAGVFDG